jgi:hypothetical protein
MNEAINSLEFADLTLSELIEHLSPPDGARDRSFALEFARWLHQRRSHLSLPLVESLRLEDVLVTLQLRNTVKLVITGTLPDHPGELTLQIGERDFPDVRVCFRREQPRVVLEVCALDYGRAGASVRLSGSPEDLPSTCLVESQHGDERFVRIKTPGGEVVTAAAQEVEFLPRS